jgi:hypothetical protein
MKRHTHLKNEEGNHKTKTNNHKPEDKNDDVRLHLVLQIAIAFQYLICIYKNDPSAASNRGPIRPETTTKMKD